MSHVDDINAQYQEREIEKESTKRGLGYINLHSLSITRDVLTMIDESDARLGNMIAFFRVGKKIRIAVENEKNPHAVAVMEELEKKGMSLNICLCSSSSIQYALSLYPTSPQNNTQAQASHSVLSASQQSSEDFDTTQNFLNFLIDASYSGAILLVKKEGSSLRCLGESESHLSLSFDQAKNIVQYLLLSAQIQKISTPIHGSFVYTYHNEMMTIGLIMLPKEEEECLVHVQIFGMDQEIDSLKNALLPSVFDTISNIHHLSRKTLIISGKPMSGKSTLMYLLLLQIHEQGKYIFTLERKKKYISPLFEQYFSTKESVLQYIESLSYFSPKSLGIHGFFSQEILKSVSELNAKGTSTRLCISAESMEEAWKQCDLIGTERHAMLHALDGCVHIDRVGLACDCAKEVPLPPEYVQDIVDCCMRYKVSVPETILKKQGCAHCSYTGTKGSIPCVSYVELSAESKHILENNGSFEEAFALGSQKLSYNDAFFLLVRDKKVAI